MAAYVLQHAQRLADKPALQIASAETVQTTSYAALERAIRGTATGFLGAGVMPGEKILLQIGNTPDFPIAYLGAITAGIFPVPLSAMLTTRELRNIYQTIRPTLTIRANGMAAGPGKTIPAEALADLARCPPAPFAMGDPDRPAYIIFTSGTSGKPRAVVHAHRAIWARQMMWDGWYGLKESDRVMHAGAFNWTYTLGTGLMDPWSIGATAIIPANETSPDALPQVMASQNVTIFAAAPGIYRRMLRGGMPALPALRHGLSAGEKLAAPTRRAWAKATQTDIHEAFGMSEVSTFISGSPNHPAPDGTSGYPQTGRKIAVLGPDGPVKRGEQGMIAVHKSDPGLMLGYLDSPAETAAKFQGDWFLSGDIGTMDDKGAITYAGRSDDMMNAGGYRVSPIEVEEVLNAHPMIVESAACAVQIRTGVFVIAAFYVATNVIEEDKLKDFASTHLAAYKIPRLFVAQKALPRGANNKLLRRRLRTEWETTHGQT